ncbi:uncharacterized protein N7469_006238 [Penicillium citrinum]|uniref:Uncharacterized protein n=1 Tax=Penicillium citrinum TaxID=5077 RepID=A0A9W9NXX9_PENCI|nr:uncharacterized protein N7469_006238 [Penicillium citrinum]KAJ5231650.1 hypothetical protein N7469_006238 [Penicillium citrinum]
MYRSALIYGQLSQNTVISDARGALDEIKRGLEANNRRWKAAASAPFGGASSTTIVSCQV